MKTYHILIGNCEELLNDFIEALFQEVCRGKAAVTFTKTARVGEFVERACDTEFDLIIQVPHNLFPELAAPTPMGLLGEGDELSSAVGRLLKLPTRLEHLAPTRWFFAGVLMRGLRRLSQA